MKTNKHPASYRDPSGYIFLKNSIIYRHINRSYMPVFSKVTELGLYQKLSAKNLLIPHEILEEGQDFIVIKPEQVDFITYPYEWSFTQIQDAALVTLHIHKIALEYGLILKDASAFNVQFHRGRPVFIDTLSFDLYKEGDPWIAYGQFCRHFLVPLLLMKYISPDLNRLHLNYIDGVPLETASKMLPMKTHFKPFIKANIHMHAKALSKYQDRFETERKPHISLRTQNNIVQNMINYISELTLDSETEWGDYYAITNYEKESFRFKEITVKKWVEKYELKTLWDVGGNNGHFARILKDSCKAILCTDMDAVAVDANYKTTKKNNEHKITPLIIDFTNQPPGIGFANTERTPFRQRVKEQQIDCILALAIVHHLSISANCTFEMLAQSFCSTSSMLLIEFVPPGDSWGEKLLQAKRDARSLFNHYNKNEFESVFSTFYEFREVLDIPDSERTLYLMARRP